MILTAPTKAITPDNGTTKDAKGTPCEFAYPTAGLVKWKNEEDTKIREKQIHIQFESLLNLYTC
jgi:hypothetical protein